MRMWNLAKTKQTPTVDVLTLDYQLAELPSSQHRAGLAGLVLMVENWLKRQPSFRDTREATCKFTRLDERGATLLINLPGLEALFNEVYAASLEEQERPQPFKNKNKEIIPPLREEDRQETDPKIGKTKTKKVYIYSVVVPKGAFIADYDPSADGDKGHWVKLWRDMLWSILRGVPTTRKPFEARAEGSYTEDAAKVWKELLQPAEYAVDLPSTYLLGAQASNAENVPFKDRARFQFLLHFWLYTAQIYVPAVINNEGSRDFVGYALAIPDVAYLKTFCDDLPQVLQNRGIELSGYRPRDCIVDLAIEGALDLMHRLRDRLITRTGEQATGYSVLAVDVIHAEKQGNNIRLLGMSRLEPDNRIDKYDTLRKAFWSPLFRKQRLLNLVKNQLWYTGFDALLSSLPYEQSIGNDYFRHDVRESFKYESETMDEEITLSTAEIDESVELPESSVQQVAACELLVYRLAQNYIRRKLKTKHDLEWKTEWNSLRQSKEGREALNKREDYKAYVEKKAKIAKSAFLDVRSTTEKMDFINYFVGTLCSVPQHLKPEEFVSLTQALYEEHDKVRTITLLALSANS